MGSDLTSFSNVMMNDESLSSTLVIILIIYLAFFAVTWLNYGLAHLNGYYGTIPGLPVIHCLLSFGPFCDLLSYSSYLLLTLYCF